MYPFMISQDGNGLHLENFWQIVSSFCSCQPQSRSVKTDLASLSFQSNS